MTTFEITKISLVVVGLILTVLASIKKWHELIERASGKNLGVKRWDYIDTLPILTESLKDSIWNDAGIQAEGKKPEVPFSAGREKIKEKYNSIGELVLAESKPMMSDFPDITDYPDKF